MTHTMVDHGRPVPGNRGRAAGRRLPIMAAISLSLLSGGCVSAAGPASNTRPAEFSASGNYLAARLADSTQDAQNATNFLRRVLLENPESGTALQRLLIQSLSAGKSDVALNAANAIVKLRPNHAMANLTLAVDDIRASRWAEADARLALIVDGPIYFIAPLLRAWVAAGDGRADAAIKLIEGVESQGRLTQLGRNHRALILDFIGRPDDAAAAFRDVARSSSASLRYFEHYANFLIRNDQPKETTEVLQKILETSPDYFAAKRALDSIAGPKPAPMITSGRSGAAFALAEIGNAISHDGTRDLAIVYLRLALATDPSSTHTAFALGDTLLRNRRSEEAIPILDTLPRSDPFYLQAQLDVATAYAEDMDDAKSVDRLEQLARHFPNSATPLIALGDLYREREKFGEAVGAYNAALARADQEQPRHWRLFFSRGVSLERLNRWPEARTDLEKALAMNPHDATILNYLGYSFLDRNIELARASELIEKAATEQPNDGYIADSLGWAYFRAGKIEQAVTALEKAILLKPQDPTINDHLGDAYWRAGRKIESRFQWNHALTFNTDPKLEERIKRKLAVGLDHATKVSETDGKSE